MHLSQWLHSFSLVRLYLYRHSDLGKITATDATIWIVVHFYLLYIHETTFYRLICWRLHSMFNRFFKSCILHGHILSGPFYYPWPVCISSLLRKYLPAPVKMSHIFSGSKIYGSYNFVQPICIHIYKKAYFCWSFWQISGTLKRLIWC